MQINVQKMKDCGIDVDIEERGENKIIHIHLINYNEGVSVHDMVKTVTNHYPLRDTETDILHAEIYEAIEKAVILHNL
jgi:hypothetical protein